MGVLSCNSILVDFFIIIFENVLGAILVKEGHRGFEAVGKEAR